MIVYVFLLKLHSEDLLLRFQRSYDLAKAPKSSTRKGKDLSLSRFPASALAKNQMKISYHNQFGIPDSEILIITPYVIEISILNWIFFNILAKHLVL